MFKGLILLLLLALQPYLYAEDGDVHTVVLEANEAPPFWSKKLPYDGVAGEIVHAISKAAGLRSKIEFKPLSRLINDDQNNDLGNPAFFIVNQDFAYIIPIALYHVSLYYYAPNHKKRLHFKSINDLKGMRIGILKGTLIDNSYFKKEGILFKESYSHESLFKKLKLGRIDMVIEIELVAHQSINKYFPKEMDNFISLRLSNASNPIAIMLAEEYPDVDEIAKNYKIGLDKIIQDGTYQNILQKYYRDNVLPENWYNELSRFEQLYKTQEDQ